MKEKLYQLLRNVLKKIAFEESIELPESFEFVIEKPKDTTHGDLSTNVALVATKLFKIAPRLLAEKIIAQLDANEYISEISTAGPGFINFRFDNKYLVHQLDEIWNSKTLGIETLEESPIVVVDYSSPNLAKEMHVGHLRSTIIGDAIARVLELKGYQVVRQNHVGDWGTQFGMLIAHFSDEESAQPGEVKLNDLESFYKAAKARFDADAEFAERARQWVVLLQSGDPKCLAMWKSFIQLSLAHCHEVYERLGVSLQPKDVRAESAYNDDLPLVVKELTEKGLLTQNDGAQCVFLEEFKGKEDEPLPLIVQKKDGGFLYASTDLAAIRYRNQVLHAKRVLYVVDARQSLHFQQVFAVALAAGFATSDMQLEHISFGMVLDKTGKPYKSREGGVTKLADLLDEAERRAKLLIEGKKTVFETPEELEKLAAIVGISSVKYADLSKNRTSDYVFDWDSMISFEGNTAPYLLYAYTRIMSIFQKANLKIENLEGPFIFEKPQEEQLAKQLCLFPEIIEMVAAKAMPHFLCGYLYDLAGAFSTFYEACPVLNCENETLQNARLKLVALTAKILKAGLELLGIPTVLRM